MVSKPVKPKSKTKPKPKPKPKRKVKPRQKQKQKQSQSVRQVVNIYKPVRKSGYARRKAPVQIVPPVMNMNFKLDGFMNQQPSNFFNPNTLEAALRQAAQSVNNSPQPPPPAAPATQYAPAPAPQTPSVPVPAAAGQGRPVPAAAAPEPVPVPVPQPSRPGTLTQLGDLATGTGNLINSTLVGIGSAAAGIGEGTGRTLTGRGNLAAGIGDGAGRLLTGGGDLVNAIMINKTARSNSAPSISQASIPQASIPQASIPQASIPRNLFGGGGGTTSAVALRTPSVAEERDAVSVFTPPPDDSKSEDKPALNPSKSSEFKPKSVEPLELEKPAPSTPQRQRAPPSTPRTPITPPPSEAKNIGDDSGVGDTKDDKPAREFKGDDNLQADKDSFRFDEKKVVLPMGRGIWGMFDRMDARDEAYEEQFKQHQKKQQLARDMDEARAEAASIAARAEAARAKAEAAARAEAARARAEAAARARAEAAAKAEAAAEAKRKQQEATAKVGKIDTRPRSTKRVPTNLEALVQKKPRDAGNLEELVAAKKQARAKKAKAAGKKRQEDMRAAAEPVKVDLSYLNRPRGVKRDEAYELAEEKEEGRANKKVFYDGDITEL